MTRTEALYTAATLRKEGWQHVMIIGKGDNSAVAGYEPKLRGWCIMANYSRIMVPLKGGKNG